LARVTGTLITVDRNDGPVLYIKARDRAGRQIKKRLGPESEWSRRKREDALREFLVDLGRTPGGPGHDITVADAAHTWLAYVEHEKARATSTVRDYRNTVKSSILPHFGTDVPLSSIDTDAVDEFRRVLLERVSRRTAQKTLVILFGLLKYARRRRWITENPAEFAEKVSVTSSGEFNVLEPEQVQAVSRAAENDQMAALFLVGAFTGLRCPGELRALRWRQLDFHNRIVHVVKNYVLGQEGVTKGKRVRSVPLSDQALVALDGLSRRPRFTAPGDLVFCTEAGAHLTGDSIRDAFYVALTAAGLGHLREKEDPIVPYDLRHTFGTLAVRTAPLTDVQSWMGHQDIQTTMRYVHYVPRHDAAARLTAAFSGLPERKAGTDRVPTGTKMSGSDVSEGT
jgi:integrase